MKNRALTVLFFISLILYTLTVRGNLGIPSPAQIDTRLNNTGQAFETSQERSRYAMILSLFYDKTVRIDNFASMATPDLGRLNGHYYSLFPPTVSALALPLFFIGLKLKATQVAVFSLSILASFLTMLLIYLSGRKLSLHPAIALFGALGFGFATNAWGYSVTLYAHLVSALFIMLGIYLTLFWKTNTWLRNSLIWLLYGLAVYTDYPNLFIYLPIVAIMSYQGLRIADDGKKLSIAYSWKYILTIFLFILSLVGYGHYNYVNFGSPMSFSNALPRVQDLKDADKATPERQKNSGQALKSRNMLEGFRSFTISADRGIIVYSPFVLLSLFGLGYLKKKEKIVELMLVSVPVTCLVLYTMFGDPYGGWAFGSRYLIAVLPPLCLLAAVGLQRFIKNLLVKAFYTLVFLYSCAVALLAPLTTNVIPPVIEARGLGMQSTYAINIEMLNNSHLNSFLYNSYLHTLMSGVQYYFTVYVLIAVSGVLLIWWRKKIV